MSLLAETANYLTHPHTRRTSTPDGDVYGPEPALLTLLKRAIASDTVGASGGGGTRTGAPVDLGALDMWNTIARTINVQWPYSGDLGKLRWPLHRKLYLWVTYPELTPEQEGHLLDLCLQWVDQIRDLLEPDKRIPLRDVACPRPQCNKTHVENEAFDGEITYDVALMTYPSEDPVRAECRVCGHQWIGPELLDLGDLIAAQFAPGGVSVQ